MNAGGLPEGERIKGLDTTGTYQRTFQVDAEVVARMIYGEDFMNKPEFSEDGYLEAVRHGLRMLAIVSEESAHKQNDTQQFIREHVVSRLIKNNKAIGIGGKLRLLMLVTGFGRKFPQYNDTVEAFKKNIRIRNKK